MDPFHSKQKGLNLLIKQNIHIPIKKLSTSNTNITHLHIVSWHARSNGFKRISNKMKSACVSSVLQTIYEFVVEIR